MIAASTPVRAARLLIGVWCGALIMTGAVVAPVLFAHVPRELAGAIAGKLFVGLSAWACVCGTVCSILLVKGGVALRDKATSAVLIATALGAVLLLVIIPVMQGARGTAWFGPLHGLSGIAFCAQALCLVRALWRS